MIPSATVNRSSAVIEYSRRGLSVIPISPASQGGKRPLVAWEPYQTRRASEQEIRSWWAQWPEANVGIVTGAISGVVVLDADGPEGQASLLTLLGSLPHTPTATTGKGLHLFFQHPGSSIGNRARLLPGLDVRGDGGFVVAAPSEHENGTFYQWQIGLNVPLMPLPETVLSLLTTSVPGTNPSSVKAGEPIQNGNRNAALYTLGRSLHAKGLSAPAIRAALEAENAERCSPPLDPRELVLIIRQATTQPDRPDFTPPPAMMSDEQILRPLATLTRRPEEGEVVTALLAVSQAIRAHTSHDDLTRRESLKTQAMGLLEDRKVERATARVQATWIEMKKHEEKDLPTVRGPLPGASIDLTLPTPWGEPVDGAALLTEIAATFTRYMVLPSHTAEAAAAWVMLTYMAEEESVDVFPILGVVSPKKRCGKTRFLRLLAYLSAKPLPSANMTPASVYRTVHAHAPTLLVDEADTFLVGNDELRGVLNSGHTRDTAFIIRTVGDDHEPRKFSTWGPRAVAMIGRLPDTLEDRAIVVKLRRKTKGELVVRKLRKTEEITTLARKIARWVADNRQRLVRDPFIPEALDDRAADNWEPLLAVAETAGGEWPARLRTAALTLSGEREEDSADVLLLADTRRAFDAEGESLSTEDLLAWLTQDGEQAARWKTWRKGKALNEVGLAKLLKPFGIEPRMLGPKDRRFRGYARVAFEDAWGRYLSTPQTMTGEAVYGSERALTPTFPPQPVHPYTLADSPTNSDTSRCTGSTGDLTPKCAVTDDEIRRCTGVQVEIGSDPYTHNPDWLNEPIDPKEIRRILYRAEE